MHKRIIPKQRVREIASLNNHIERIVTRTKARPIAKG